jgi:hypothetical protein
VAGPEGIAPSPSGSKPLVLLLHQRPLQESSRTLPNDAEARTLSDLVDLPGVAPGKLPCKGSVHPHAQARVGRFGWSRTTDASVFSGALYY